MTLLHRARRLVRRVGLDVHRFDAHQAPQARLPAALAHHGVDGVIDVGANDGGFARALRDAGWRGGIVSFEPLPDAHQRLLQAAQGDAAWTVAPRCALGDGNGSAVLNVAANSASSSLLPMLPAHLQAAPESAVVGRHEVPLMRLDDVGLPALQQARRPFLKIDTQGYELPVLLGAPQTLARCVGVQLELSLLPLYDGQVLWRELIDWLGARGFVPWDLQPGFSDAARGRLLQMDGIFFRDGAA